MGAVLDFAIEGKKTILARLKDGISPKDMHTLQHLYAVDPQTAGTDSSLRVAYEKPSTNEVIGYDHIVRLNIYKSLIKDPDDPEESVRRLLLDSFPDKKAVWNTLMLTSNLKGRPGLTIREARAADRVGYSSEDTLTLECEALSMAVSKYIGSNDNIAAAIADVNADLFLQGIEQYPQDYWIARNAASFLDLYTTRTEETSIAYQCMLRAAVKSLRRDNAVDIYGCISSILRGPMIAENNDLSNRIKAVMNMVHKEVLDTISDYQTRQRIAREHNSLISKPQKKIGRIFEPETWRVNRGYATLDNLLDELDQKMTECDMFSEVPGVEDIDYYEKIAGTAYITSQENPGALNLIARWTLMMEKPFMALDIVEESLLIEPHDPLALATKLKVYNKMYDMRFIGQIDLTQNEIKQFNMDGFQTAARLVRNIDGLKAYDYVKEIDAYLELAGTYENTLKTEHNATHWIYQRLLDRIEERFNEDVEINPLYMMEVLERIHTMLYQYEDMGKRTRDMHSRIIFRYMTNTNSEIRKQEWYVPKKNGEVMAMCFEGENHLEGIIADKVCKPDNIVPFEMLGKIPEERYDNYTMREMAWEVIHND